MFQSGLRSHNWSIGYLPRFISGDSQTLYPLHRNLIFSSFAVFVLKANFIIRVVGTDPGLPCSTAVMANQRQHDRSRPVA